jgi:predicted O-methyltransferase YrrM
MEFNPYDLDFLLPRDSEVPLEELLKQYEYFGNSSNAKVWKEKILDIHIDTSAPVTIMEIGTGIGSSAEWMNTHICTHPDSFIHTAGVDNKKGIDEYANNRLKQCPKVKYYNQYGISVMRHLGIKFDMVYIDGAHKYLSVLNDAKFALKYLKDDGIIIFDDYHDAWPEVVQAVNEFVNTNHLTLEQLSSSQAMVKR